MFQWNETTWCIQDPTQLASGRTSQSSWCLRGFFVHNSLNICFVYLSCFPKAQKINYNNDNDNEYKCPPWIICLANVFAASVQIRLKIFINIYIDCKNQQFYGSYLIRTGIFVGRNIFKIQGTGGLS